MISFSQTPGSLDNLKIQTCAFCIIALFDNIKVQVNFGYFLLSFCFSNFSHMALSGRFRFGLFLPDSTGCSAALYAHHYFPVDFEQT
jgi:hypothetical protein